MPEKKSESAGDAVKQCISLASAIVLASGLLMYFSPTWPTAISVVALCGLGGLMTLILCRKGN